MMTAQEWRERGAQILATLSSVEREALRTLYDASGRELADLAYSGHLRRMRVLWSNATGREWVEAELYYCLLAMIS